MNEQLEEQASLYVLGLLEGAEAQAFEQQLEHNTALRALVDDLDEAAAVYSRRAPAQPLPPDLRARVLRRVTVTPPLPFPKRINWLPWAIAACLALACCYLAADRVNLRQRVGALEQRDLLSQIQIASLSSQVQNTPNANAVVIWDEEKQRGMLKVTQLPKNEANRDYQLWLVDPRYKNPVDGGVFHVSNEGTIRFPFHPAVPISDAKGFAISLERKGGVPKAEGPIVLLGK